MGILVDKRSGVIVQGVTGHQGAFHTRLMLEYGTRVVAGVTPGKGGEDVGGVPVYDTVEEALASHNAEVSIIFVPAPYARDAALEAIGGGLRLVVVITEHIPIKDSVEIMAHAQRAGAVVIGPNTPGIITPGQCKVGIMPAQVFKPGPVGMLSRSGTLTYEVAWRITEAGLGQSTCLGTGGDPVTGLSFTEALELFRGDDGTEAVVLIGEIGGDAEERAAEYIRRTKFPKPVVAFVAGRTAPPGRRMGHAGAIIMGGRGTAQSKIDALRGVGVEVADTPKDLGRLLSDRLKKG